MKKLLIAIAFAAFGTGAYANEVTPHKEEVAKKEIYLDAMSSETKILSDLQSRHAALIRKERVFLFTDPCGVQWQIHVFASNQTSNYEMFLIGSTFFHGGVNNSSDGCYHNQP